MSSTISTSISFFFGSFLADSAIGVFISSAISLHTTVSTSPIKTWESTAMLSP